MFVTIGNPKSVGSAVIPPCAATIAAGTNRITAIRAKTLILLPHPIPETKIANPHRYSKLRSGSSVQPTWSARHNERVLTIDTFCCLAARFMERFVERCPFHPSRIGLGPTCRPHQRRSAQISGSFFAFSVPFCGKWGFSFSAFQLFSLSAFQPLDQPRCLCLPGVASERSPVVHLVRRFGICVNLCKSVVKDYRILSADWRRFSQIFFGVESKLLNQPLRFCGSTRR